MWVGMGREAAGVKGTKKGKGQAREWGTFVQKQSAHSGTTNVMVQCQKAWRFKKTEEEDLRGTGRVIIVSRDLKGCHMEEILLGPVSSGDIRYTQLHITF